MTEPATAIALRAEHIGKRYGNTAVVQDLSLALRRGEILGLLGPNGAGKSTTLQMLAGCLAPDSGSIEIGGFDLLRQARAAKACLGYLPEHPPLYPELTVDEYLRFAARLHRVARDQIQPRVAEAKQRCGLAGLGGKVIAKLSKGTQQRVGIAQATLHRPAVLILDEPTVGLDPNQARELRSLIRELSSETSAIFASHILPEVENLCDRVLVLHQGRAVFNDSRAALHRLYAGAWLTAGFHAPPPASELAAIAGVTAVETLPSGLFRLCYQPGCNPTAALTARAEAQGWGLHTLAPASASLEEVFAELTGQPAAPATA